MRKPTSTISSTDLRRHLSEALTEVARGRSVTITRYGTSIATLNPIAGEAAQLDLSQLRQRTAGGRSALDYLSQDRDAH